MNRYAFTLAALFAGFLASSSAWAVPFSFSTGSPDGLLGSASRPASAGKSEIESADDFTTTATTTLTSATFTGLITGGADLGAIGAVGVEFYRIFPKDSDTVRTPQVPSRVNSPSDVEFVGRDTAAGNLTFSTSLLDPSFTAANSVLNGINKSPNQTTGGEGAIRGIEVLFNVTFTTPVQLPADHYFFIPQVQVTGGEFYWLSATKTIPAPADLQSWIRSDNIDPDWLRIGTDVIGGATPPNFNAAFSLTGTVPEPASWLLLAAGLLLLRRLHRRQRVAV
jgi:hypothetical protein